MAGVILYLLYYVYSKDHDYTKNIHSVASVVEDLNREIYYLKKNMTETQKSIQLNTRGMSDEEIYQEIERTVYDMVQPLSLGLKQMSENIAAIDTKVESRVASLENGVKQFSIPSSVNGNDDKKIISLFKQGISLDDISKELHISKPEVEFVLKINKIR
jgi:DNA-binding transcriptional regulator GbsR (MarR family)